MASPCCFWTEALQISVVIHGDDYTAVRPRDGLEIYREGLEHIFQLTVKGHLGEAGDCDKEVRVLNRIVRIAKDGIHYEADSRRVEMLIKAVGLEDGKHSSVPGVNVPNEEVGYEALLCDNVEDEVHAREDDDNLHDVTAVHSVAPVVSDVPRPPGSILVQPGMKRRSTTMLRLRIASPEVTQSIKVKAYAEVYGGHPSTIVATSFGRFKQVSSSAGPFAGKSQASMASRREFMFPTEQMDKSKRERAELLSGYLKHGVMWERSDTPPLSLCTMVSW